MTNRAALAAAYDAANTAHRQAAAALGAAALAFRAGKISDAQYLAARQAERAALDAFDVAHAAYAPLVEDVPLAAEPVADNLAFNF